MSFISLNTLNFASKFVFSRDCFAWESHVSWVMKCPCTMTSCLSWHCPGAVILNPIPVYGTVLCSYGSQASLLSLTAADRRQASLRLSLAAGWSLLGCFMNGTTAHLGFSSLPHPLTPTKWIHALACGYYPQTFISLLNLRPPWPHLANTPCSHFLSWVPLCFCHLGVFPFTSSSAICKTVFGEILSSTFWQNCGGRFFCIYTVWQTDKSCL